MYVLKLSVCATVLKVCILMHPLHRVKGLPRSMGVSPEEIVSMGGAPQKKLSSRRARLCTHSMGLRGLLRRNCQRTLRVDTLMVSASGFLATFCTASIRGGGGGRWRIFNILVHPKAKIQGSIEGVDLSQTICEAGQG